MSNIVSFPRHERSPDYSLMTSLGVVLKVLFVNLQPSSTKYVKYLSHPYSTLLATAIDPVTGDLRSPLRGEWRRSAKRAVEEICESLDLILECLSARGICMPNCGLLRRALAAGSDCLWDEPTTRHEVIDPIRSLADEVLHPRNAEQAIILYNRVVGGSAWWLKHPTAGAVRAPGHRLRSFTGEIQFGSNYVNVKLAIEHCAETVMAWCARAPEADDLPTKPLKLRFADALSASVSLDGFKPYLNGYPRSRDGMMIFGTQGLSTRDFAEIMFRIFGLNRMQNTGFIASAPPITSAPEHLDTK